MEKDLTEIKSNLKIQDIINLGQLSLQFSRVERTTLHEDGLRTETDSDHTVMLSILGCSIASILRPDLDLGKIAQYALVHDLVEVYAGDTVTINITEAGKKEKEAKEARALARINKEFGKSFPWLIKTIKSYESLDTIEARFVKGLDKLLPKITHLLNNGQYIKQIGITKTELIKRYDQQIIEMSKYSYDLPEIMDLRDKLAELFIEMMYPNN